MNALYTIGYSGWKPEQLRDAVTTRHAVLWDIRATPWSKTPEWQRESLRSLLGDAYAHVPALGNKNYKNGGPIELARPAAAVEPARAVLSRQPLVLLCGCRDYWSCHREDAADYLADALDLEVVEHLIPPAAIRPAPAPELTPVINWRALRAALALRQYQRAYGIVGRLDVPRTPEQARAVEVIEAAKAAELQALIESRKGGS